ncbi:bifunctional diguanylate cyclase/phosphodiesterase [Echinimonas agarilytica]|uniref:EAL domain-containing protein n=1 Tax=Echinimonas agarilytica TaxID=1215918 RepID=A0AA41W7I3_9GAMM|nr:EAL domain-containing protein [Echinimonas agarilytica]MCM2680330.1 EAL domain-containing protein [Echinimonas agarilytica]
MSLYRQVLLLLIMITVLSLTAVMTLNLKNSATYMEGQLRVTAESALTSLGMRLAPILQPYDQALAESTVWAAFDGAYYKSIEVLVYENDETIRRVNSAQPGDVPEWFTQLFEFEPVIAEAPITNGWNEVAHVRIEGHPGYIQQQLWSLGQRLLMFYGGLFVLCAAVAALVLRWVISKPLGHIERQVHAIEERDFTYRIPNPATPELKRVVKAMNHLTGLLSERFQSNAKQLELLRVKVQQDGETHVSNRRYFVSELNVRIDEREPLAVVMLSLLERDKIRKNNGYKAWLDILKSTVRALESVFKEDGVVIGRLSETDFAVLVPVLPDDDLSARLSDISSKMAGLYRVGIAPHEAVSVLAGIVVRTDEYVTDVFTRLDQALRDAHSVGINPWLWAEPGDNQKLRSGQEWVDLLHERLKLNDLELSYQPLVKSLGEGPIHHEVYARIHDETGQSLSAGLFVPVIDQFDLGSKLDRAVIERIFENDNITIPVVMNVSLSSVRDTHFLKALAEVPDNRRSLLIFEVTEVSVSRDLRAITSFVTVLRSLGFGFGVDNLGVGSRSLDYLTVLRPDYVKLAPSLCRHVDPETTSIITAIGNTVHNLNIPVYGTSVESDEQLEAILKAGVDGFQGYITKRV